MASETLVSEYQPGELYVKRYVRPKYTRPDGEGVIVASLPTRPLDKGIAGPGLLAQILISKLEKYLSAGRLEIDNPAAIVFMQREERDSAGGAGTEELSLCGLARRRQGRRDHLHFGRNG